MFSKVLIYLFISFTTLSDHQYRVKSLEVNNNVTVDDVVNIWNEEYDQPLNSTIRMWIDSIIESIYLDTNNTNVNETLKTACQFILRNDKVHDIDLKKEIVYDFENFPNLLLIRIKSKCQAITRQIQIDHANNELFSGESIKCNTSLVQHCTPIYSNVFFTQTARKAVHKINFSSVVPVNDLCWKYQMDSENFTRFFQELNFTEGVRLTSIICQEYEKVSFDEVGTDEEMIESSSLNALSNAFRSFFGNMSLQQLRKVWCKLIYLKKAFEKPILSNYLKELNRIYGLVDYFLLKSLYSCYFGNEYENELAIIEDSIYTNKSKQQPEMEENSSGGSIEGFLKQMQSEFEKYKNLLQEQFQLHIKTLRDEFESYKSNLTTSVSDENEDDS